jgi:VanZ family protein
MRPCIRRWGPAVFIMLLIFIASAIPGSELPTFGGWDTIVKKGGHMFGYALLAAAYFHALNNRKRITPLQFILAVCMAILYAVTDEFHQSYTSGRTASLWDVCIDSVGGFIGPAVWYLIRTRLSNPYEAAGL